MTSWSGERAEVLVGAFVEGVHGKGSFLTTW